MSVANEHFVETPKARGDAALRHIGQVVGLTKISARQLPQLSAALAEVVYEEIMRTPDFRMRVQQTFERIVESAAQSGPAERRTRNAVPRIAPIRYVDPARFATYGPSDPYALLEQYGDEQLPLVLKKFLMSDLTKSAALVQTRNPGAQLQPKAKKADVIEFIVRYVTSQN